MKIYNGVILKVAPDNNHIRFGWHDPSLFDHEKEFCPKLPPNANFNGIYQTHNSDVTKDGMIWISEHGVLRIVASNSRVMMEVPVHSIPSVMFGQIEFLLAGPWRLNEQWYGELFFPNPDWSKCPGKLWTRFDVVDEGTEDLLSATGESECMSLTKPEDRPVVEAAAAAFLKVCMEQGIKEEQVLQTTIAIAAASIQKEAGKDKTYALDLLGRYGRTLRSAVFDSK